MTSGRQTPRQDALIEHRVDLILAGKLKPGQPLPGDQPAGLTPVPKDQCPCCRGKMEYLKTRGYICLRCQ